MNNNYERKETLSDKYRHDCEEFKNRITQLEDELEQAQKKIDAFEGRENYLRDVIKQQIVTIGKVKEYCEERRNATVREVLDILRGEA